jgi:hypothetical protein
MTIRTYFETLSPGLQAKLDAKYRMNQKQYRVFNTGAIQTRFETGNLMSKPVEMAKMPTV